ncbi:MAG: hypothetical protein AAGN46_12765, partial [Acidobacteriota bacterium]
MRLMSVSRPLGGLIWLALLGSAAPLVAQTAALVAPSVAVVGSQVEVSWTGPGGDRDFLSIDPEGSDEAFYGDYVYTRKGSPLRLQVPSTPGRYLIRYHSGESGYPVLGQTPLEVVDTTAQLQSPTTSPAGSTISVGWTGPGNARDFISIDPAGADDRRYGPYAYTRDQPVSLDVPDAPGDYEIRYHLAKDYRVIGRVPLEVTGVEATIDVPASVAAGSEL